MANDTSMSDNVVSKFTERKLENMPLVQSENYCSIYTNHVGITASTFDVQMTLIQIKEILGESHREVQATVYMSPQNQKKRHDDYFTQRTSRF